MPNALIEDRQLQGPQTHVLVVGVGDYPHFGDGGQPTSAADFGMKQLTSPVYSANEIAAWFVAHYDHPIAPLGTVRLLMSDIAGGVFEHPSNGPVNCPRAAFSPLRTAVREWKAAGDEHEENVLLFYFSGHGVSDGARTVLILDDYGKDPLAPLDGAFDFSQLHRAMAHCKARTQCYFVDACRVAGDRLIDGANIGQGTLIPNDPDASIGLARIRAPIFYSTVSGAEAFGRAGQSSVFAKAVVSGLSGAASDDTSGVWRVDTSQLLKLIRFALKRAEDCGASLEQINQSEHMVDFPLNTPPQPFVVPVVIGCRDKAKNASALLSWHGPQQSDSRSPSVEQHWDVELQPAEYEFRAQLDGQTKQERRFVRPPYREVMFS